jgi:hypothetical protein
MVQDTPTDPCSDPPADHTGEWIIWAIVVTVLLIDLLLWRTGHKTLSQKFWGLRGWRRWLTLGALLGLLGHLFVPWLHFG